MSDEAQIMANPNITAEEVLQYARVLAKTDSNGITESGSTSNGTFFLNEALFDMRRKLIDKREDLFIQESQRDIASAQITGGTTPGKFLFPDNMWFLKNMQINLIDSSNASLYKQAQKVDSSNVPSGVSWEWLKANQPNDQPLFDFRGDWFEIAPTPTQTITNGIKIFYFTAPTLVLSVANTLSFPEFMDYRPLSYKVASIFLSTLGNNEKSLDLDNKYNNMLNNFIVMVGTGDQTPLKASIIRDTGFNY